MPKTYKLIWDSDSADSGSMLLSVSGSNDRYLVNQNGDVVFLSGFHTWYDVQDGGSTDPPPTMDWDEYFNSLASYGCNFTKLWAMETGRGWSDDTNQWFTPTRYTRSGSANDNDGKAQFDLDSVNTTYLNRLYDRASSCQNFGIYVCIQLFQGWQIEQNKGGTGDPTTYHPYNIDNNINSIDGDDNDDGHLVETHFLAAQGNNTLSYQESLVDAIIDKVNNLDNIIWEVSNEDTGSPNNTDWQYYMINYISTYESSKPKQHLIGMTKQWPNESDAVLDNSSADWVSYGTGKADAIHGASNPVSMYDTDHTVGLTSLYSWAWESLCNGHGGAWYMDEWDGALYGTDRRSNSTYQRIRSNLGYVLEMANAVDLINMLPASSLCSTGYCIAKDQASNADYICYNPNALNTFTLDLTNASGTLNLSWRNCETGATTTDTVSGGAERTLTNPWTGDVSAVRVYH